MRGPVPCCGVIGGHGLNTEEHCFGFDMAQLIGYHGPLDPATVDSDLVENHDRCPINAIVINQSIHDGGALESILIDPVEAHDVAACVHGGYKLTQAIEGRIRDHRVGSCRHRRLWKARRSRDVCG